MTKVLVFESDPSFAGELRTELGRLGATVQVVDDGNVGLQVALTERPDLILLSIELPRMNGFSVCNKLKKDPQLKDVPLVIMSSESSEETFEQHRKLRTRAEDYVHKPIAFGELLQHIRNFIPIEAPPDSEGILIDDLEMGLDDDLSMTTHAQPSPIADDAARAPEIPRADDDIDQFLGGAFTHLLADDEEAATTVKPLSSMADLEKLTQAATAKAARSAPAAKLAPSPAAPAVKQDSGLLGKAASVRPPVAALLASAVDTAEMDRLRGEAARAQAEADQARAELDGARGDIEKARAEAQAQARAEADKARDDADKARAEIARTKDEIVRLAREADDARSGVGRMETELSLAREGTAEAARLRRELDELKRASAVAMPSAPAKPGTVSSREFLDLREALNKKDKEILALRDQMSRKDKEVLDLRDQLLALDREKADHVDRILELERGREDQQALIDAASAEKTAAEQRIRELDERARKDAAELATRAGELATARAAAVAASSAHAAAQRAGEENAAQALEEAVTAERARGEAALAGAISEHRRELVADLRLRGHRGRSGHRIAGRPTHQDVQIGRAHV